jgi:hypothetical protein
MPEAGYGSYPRQVRRLPSPSYAAYLYESERVG